MIDLVEKAQGKRKFNYATRPDRRGLYRYKRKFKTLGELAEIAGIRTSTLSSRFSGGSFSSIEEAVHAPIDKRYHNKNRKFTC